MTPDDQKAVPSKIINAKLNFENDFQTIPGINPATSAWTLS